MKGQDNYYRLQMVDQDDSTSFSDLLVIRHQRKTRSDLEVFPNPSSGLVNFSFQSPNDDNITLQVLNSSGQIIHQEKRAVMKGLLTQGRLNLSELPAGIYVLQLKGQRTVENSMFF